MFISCPSLQDVLNGADRTIIEVDGVNHVPYTVDQIEIFAGKSSSRGVSLNTSNPIILSRTALFFRCKSLWPAMLVDDVISPPASLQRTNRLTTIVGPAYFPGVTPSFLVS